MSAEMDVRVEGLGLYFIPFRLREPLKFGRECLEACECVRVRFSVRSLSGRRAEGWGETPLGLTWAWPSSLPIDSRMTAARTFCLDLARAWSTVESSGHALELGYAFIREVLPDTWASFNASRTAAGEESMPWLAALLCASPFDLALHDAYGKTLGLPTFSTFGRDFLNHDLAWFFGEGAASPFAGRYPEDYFRKPTVRSLEVWHLVGAADALEGLEAKTGQDTGAAYPATLRGWIGQDGLRALKVKLLGADEEADYARLAAVGRIAREEGVPRLGVDFNCTVADPAYVLGLLDRLASEYPAIYSMLLYVEQPFPPGLTGMDVAALGSRLPLLMDESAVDWRSVELGRELGWTGLALKTCKTLTGAILSLCRAGAAGMAIMVQDLTNPMLALIPHALLGAHAPTMAGIEANAAQYCPDASLPEAAYHPDLYRRRGGRVSLETLGGAGLGYGGAERARELPPTSFEAGAA
jgi:L-alanine-DL-glutamate epimerase-like enolase superfamily enzyme